MEMLISALSENITIVVIGTVIVFGMTIKAVTKMVSESSRERSRREIAAYIAEGSLSPEQGERLMHAADVDRMSRMI